MPPCLRTSASLRATKTIHRLPHLVLSRNEEAVNNDNRTKPSAAIGSPTGIEIRCQMTGKHVEPPGWTSRTYHNLQQTVADPGIAILHDSRVDRTAVMARRQRMDSDCMQEDGTSQLPASSPLLCSTNALARDLRADVGCLICNRRHSSAQRLPNDFRAAGEMNEIHSLRSARWSTSSRPINGAIVLNSEGNVGYILRSRWVDRLEWQAAVCRDPGCR